MAVVDELKVARHSWLAAYIHEGWVGEITLEVSRRYRVRNARNFRATFNRDKTPAALWDLLVTVLCDADGGRPDPQSLAVLADAIEESPSWSKGDKDLAWFLSQLRLAGGVKTAGVR